MDEKNTLPLPKEINNIVEKLKLAECKELDIKEINKEANLVGFHAYLDDRNKEDKILYFIPIQKDI